MADVFELTVNKTRTERGFEKDQEWNSVHFNLDKTASQWQKFEQTS
jgi:hypothetical protein